MTVSDNYYIDAVIVRGTSKTHSVSINQKTEDGQAFEPFDLSDYYIRFRVLGSATADALVLLEKIITQASDEDVDGIITDASNGQFQFHITAEDTNTLGTGKFPISIEVMDADTDESLFVLTEGGYQGEFNKIQIVEC